MKYNLRFDKPGNQQKVCSAANLLRNLESIHSLQVAEILAVSQNTAYAIVRSKQIHSIRVGRSYRIPLDAVIDYLRKH